MAYAATADIQAVVAQFTIDSNSVPTTTQVGLLRDQIEGQINALLAAKGITVPFATDSSADQDAFAAFLKHLSAFGAAAATLKAMFPDASGPGETPAYAFFQSGYKDGLAMLQDGTGIPLSLSEAATTIAPSTMNTRNPDDDEDLGDRANPTFERPMSKEW
mgnify:CR=1 FL=1